MADFTGFTFNGKKSSDMGITRVSNGSRYNEDLLPAFQDRTAQVAGADRMDFFGSNYTSRAIPIQIAFDTLTDKQYRDLRTWLGDKQIHPFFFFFSGGVKVSIVANAQRLSSSASMALESFCVRLSLVTVSAPAPSLRQEMNTSDVTAFTAMRLTSLYATLSANTPMSENIPSSPSL